MSLRAWLSAVLVGGAVWALIVAAAIWATR